MYVELWPNKVAAMWCVPQIMGSYGGAPAMHHQLLLQLDQSNLSPMLVQNSFASPWGKFQES